MNRWILALAVAGLAMAGALMAAGCSGTAMSCCGGGSGAAGGQHQHGAATGAAQAAPAAFANTKCPIMGSPIDPAKVPESLARVYKGKKIAFCCAGCPAQWDKLTDAEKDARLQ